MQRLRLRDNLRSGNVDRLGLADPACMHVGLGMVRVRQPHSRRHRKEGGDKAQDYKEFGRMFHDSILLRFLYPCETGSSSEPQTMQVPFFA